MSAHVVLKIEAVRERDPEDLDVRTPCDGCSYLGQGPERCRVMRARAVALGLPDCMQGFIYVETVR